MTTNRANATADPFGDDKQKSNGKDEKRNAGVLHSVQDDDKNGSKRDDDKN
jgi:hypothetical protein